MVVNHAQKDTRGMEPITTLRSADNARRVKRRRRLVVLRVSDGKSFLFRIFISDHIFISKIPEADSNTFSLISLPLPVILASTEAAKVFVTTARKVGIQILKAQRSASNAS